MVKNNLWKKIAVFESCMLASFMLFEWYHSCSEQLADRKQKLTDITNSDNFTVFDHGCQILSVVFGSLVQLATYQQYDDEYHEKYTCYYDEGEIDRCMKHHRSISIVIAERRNQGNGVPFCSVGKTVNAI